MIVLDLFMFVQNKFSILNQTKIMKKIITLLLIVFAFSGCSNDNDDTIQNPILGKWKLVETRTLIFGSSESVDDLSDQNITYTFDSKSNLTVNTNGKIETFKYEYKIDYLSGTPSSPEEKKWPFVIINNQKWTYVSLAPNKIIIGKSYVDGSDLYLVKQ